MPRSHLRQIGFMGLQQAVDLGMFNRQCRRHDGGKPSRVHFSCQRYDSAKSKWPRKAMGSSLGQGRCPGFPCRSAKTQRPLMPRSSWPFSRPSRRQALRTTPQVPRQEAFHPAVEVKVDRQDARGVGISSTKVKFKAGLPQSPRSKSALTALEDRRGNLLSIEEYRIMAHLPIP